MNLFSRTWRRLGAAGAIALSLGLGQAAPAAAKDAAPAVEDPVLEAKMVRIASELRCLVCQNETIAASNADLAVDLRRQVREMLQRGDSEREILDYMTARYGDFVLYRPPLKGSTAVLWFGPAVLLFVGVATLLLILWRRNRLSPDRFEPDMDPYDTDESDPSAAPRIPPAPPAPPIR
jgi:cytochrome c-type biogenesis protein CcmH